MTTPAGNYLAHTELSREEVEKSWKEGTGIKCDDVFDFACPMQEVPMDGGRVGIAKAQFASRKDAILFQTTHYMSLSNSHIYFLDDLKAGDAESYKTLISNAVAGSKKAAEDRLSRAGIVLAGQMPPAGGVPGSSRGRA